MLAIRAATLPDRRRGALIASGAVALVALLVMLGAQASIAIGDYSLFITIYMVTLPTAVGIVVLWQRPGHGIGRLTLAIGLAVAGAVYLDGFLALMGPVPFVSDAVDPPLLVRSLLETLRELVPAAAVWGGGILLVAWFPDGRPTGAAGAAVTWLLVATGILALLSVVLDPVLRSAGLVAGGAVGDAGPLAAVSGNAAIAALVAAFAIAVVDLAMRYRRADPMRRAQIRWVIAAAGLGAILTALVILTGLGIIPFEIPGLWDVWILSLMLPVLAIGVAVTRYHLYDIDRIVSSTIAYSIVSLVLVAVFAAVIVGLQAALATLTNGETIAVAASTLLAASLFNPVRVRVQRTVDRRFHRARYDAERTVAGFAGRLRNQLDLPTLTGELRRTTNEAVEPMTTGVWLRRNEGRL